MTKISIESNEVSWFMMFLKKWSQLSVKELRSATGEKMREVMYWYMKNPEAVGEDSLECYAILLMVQKSCTSWYDKYPIFCRVFYIPGGAGFWPSTVFFSSFVFKSNFLLGNQEVIKSKVIQQNLQHGEFFPWETFSAAQALRSLEIFDAKQTSIQQASKD